MSRNNERLQVDKLLCSLFTDNKYHPETIIDRLGAITNENALEYYCVLAYVYGRESVINYFRVNKISLPVYKSLCLIYLAKNKKRPDLERFIRTQYKSIRHSILDLLTILPKWLNYIPGKMIKISDFRFTLYYLYRSYDQNIIFKILRDITVDFISGGIYYKCQTDLLLILYEILCGEKFALQGLIFDSVQFGDLKLLEELLDDERTLDIFCSTDMTYIEQLEPRSLVLLVSFVYKREKKIKVSPKNEEFLANCVDIHMEDIKEIIKEIKELEQ